MIDRCRSPAHPTTWSYHSTDGMGLLEFLEWARPEHAAAAASAGYSRWAGSETGAGPRTYVQEGRRIMSPAQTDTGAQSARATGIRRRPGYVEIGNEDNFDRAATYDGRYASLRRSRQSIQTSRYCHLRCSMTPDVVDDHYYKREQDVREARHYDKPTAAARRSSFGEWPPAKARRLNFGAARMTPRS